MDAAVQTIVALETQFWQALVDQDADTAVSLLDEPALLVSSHGVMRFGHDDYRRMAEHSPLVVTEFALSGMDVVFPQPDTAVLVYQVDQTVASRDGRTTRAQQMLDSSVWTRAADQQWRCVMHTETPLGAEGAP